MKKYYIHKQIFSLLSALIFITSYKVQDKTHLTKVIVIEQKENTSGKPEVNTPADDPYFVVMRDTVSTLGPCSITRNVLQDKKGNYWFANWEGIISYDGKLFINITLKEGLRHFHVFSILEDKTGNIWFGAVNGVCRYDPLASIRTGEKSFTYFSEEINE